MTFYVRNLPHWQPPPGADIFITWRLYGSLPANMNFAAPPESGGKLFLRYDGALDKAETGPVWLSDPRVAECLIEALRKGQAQNLFGVKAYAIMANHVHVLLEPRAPIGRITQSIKGASAREANRVLDQAGMHFWQQESFDHWIRTPQEWQRIETYILQNPVKAGLVTSPELWPWSSASRPID